MLTFKLSIYKKYVFIPFLIWFLSFFIAEFSLQQLGDRTTEDIQGIFTQFNNSSYKLSPNVAFFAKYASGPFSVFTDGLGLRCDAARKYSVKKGDAVDILFIGDSQGFGNGVNYENTIAGRIAIIAEGKGVRVANESVGGHALRNQFELLQWLQNQKNLQISNYVILLTPVMATSACDSFATAFVSQDGRLYDKKKNNFEMIVLWFKTHSVVYARLRDAIRNIGLGANPLSETPLVFQMYNANTDEEEAVRKLASCLKEFRDFADSNSATLSVVYVPLTNEVDFISLRRIAETKGLKLDPDLPIRVSKRAAEELGISFFNIRNVLEKANDNGQQLHLKADSHYNTDLSIDSAYYLWQEIETVLLKTNDVSN